MLNQDVAQQETVDPIGKIPLDTQQLALARERAIGVNDKDLANKLGDKIDELLKRL